MRITPSPAGPSSPSPAPNPAQRVEAPSRTAAPTLASPPQTETRDPMVIHLSGGRKVELHPDELAKVIDKMNEAARIFNHTLRFEMTEDNQIKVRVLNSQTGHVVREIPPDRALEIFARLEDIIGVLLDVRV